MSCAYDVVCKDGSVPIKMWTKGVYVEEAAMAQLADIAAMPFIVKHVAVMPDVHMGKGTTIGTVFASRGAVIPAAVGVDIGCGMQAVRTNLTASDLPDNLNELRTAIELAVPHGRTNNGGYGDKGSFEEPGTICEMYLGKNNIEEIEYLIDYLGGNTDSLMGRMLRQFGTLGTGNHFIELCLDEEDNVWIMLHTGSRGIGNYIGTAFTNLAKEKMKEFYIILKNKDLAYLTENSDEFSRYISAVNWAQHYALSNRRCILNTVLTTMNKVLNTPVMMEDEPIDCYHNFLAMEHHFSRELYITRKGAVRVRDREFGIIPGSMGARSYIVSGKGDEQSFNSCSHGAGRLMSRSEARKKFTLEDQIAQTQGIECRKDIDIIDEIPAAYKPIDDVMKAQDSLVSIAYVLRQILVIKG